MKHRLSWPVIDSIKAFKKSIYPACLLQIERCQGSCLHHSCSWRRWRGVCKVPQGCHSPDRSSWTAGSPHSRWAAGDKWRDDETWEDRKPERRNKAMNMQLPAPLCFQQRGCSCLWAWMTRSSISLWHMATKIQREPTDTHQNIVKTHFFAAHRNKIIGGYKNTMMKRPLIEFKVAQTHGSH